ncbi:MAG TPA: phosphatase PAP2 family protein [Ferruginibacter sp.]|nr:phosphatase PAP2 family protein [Ferruginibacter sp.]
MSRLKSHHHLRFSDWEKVFLALILFGAAFVFIYQVLLVFHYESVVWDEKVFLYVRSHQSEWMTRLMKVFTFIGSAWVLVPAYLVLIVWAYYYLKNKWLSLHIFIIAVSSLLMMLMLKKIFKRQRPDESLIGEISGMSFPSGHSYMSFTFFGLLIYIIQRSSLTVMWKRILQLACLLIASTIALSRVYLGVHYFSDVLAGMSLGWIGLVLMGFVFYLWHRERM